MSYWLKGIVLILVLELFIPSTKFKISGYFKKFICMKDTAESYNMCKKKISKKNAVITREMFDKARQLKKKKSKEMFKDMDNPFGKKVTPPKK